MSNNINKHLSAWWEKFQEALHDIKEFILDLIRKKQDKVQEQVKEDIDNIVQKDNNTERPSSWLDKIKEKISEKLNWENNTEKQSNSPKSNSYSSQTPPSQEQHFQDQDEYMPQDTEFWESMWTSPRFAEIYPAYSGYYISGKKSYFDPNTNLWAKKKQLTDIHNNLDTKQKKYTYAWVIPKWLVGLPLPGNSLPDPSSLVYNGNTPPIFRVDQNNCLYFESFEKQYISFDFYTHQNTPALPPINQDSEKIIFNDLSQEAQSLMNSLKWGSTKNIAWSIHRYIISTKKYSTKQQGSLHKKSNSSNYLSHLDKSPVLECFSAATLFAGMCRELSIPCRVIVWHMSQEIDNWKSLLGSNNGHAWNEFWDEKSQKWIHIDATPQEKEVENDQNHNQDTTSNNNWESSEKQAETDQSWDSQNNQSSDKDWSSQPSDTDNSSNSWDNSWDPQQWENNPTKDSNEQSKDTNYPSKSPTQALEELIEQAKQDSLSQQAEQLKDTIEKLENVHSKEKIREILDNADVSDFAKDIIDKIGNEEILRQEQDQISEATDESQLDALEQESLLDEKYKKKLIEYSETVRKKIEEEKKRQKSKMQRMWFREDELHLFQMYIALEKDVDSEVRAQIRALEKILPKQYHTIRDKQNYYRSGPRIWNTGKLIEHTLTGDPNVFRRDKQVRESNEINMFETIIIDRSGSMWNFENAHSPMRASVKAWIIRAKVLEYFKVEFSILFFDDVVEEVMSFGEIYTDKHINKVPSRLMRALQKSWWTNIWEPLAYTFWEMRKHQRKTKQKSFWNISFIWDGKPYSGLTWAWLKWLINEIRNSWYGLTAYYIGWSGQDQAELEWYFWKQQDGWTIIVPDISQLTPKLIWSYNKGLRNIIRKYSK